MNCPKNLAIAYVSLMVPDTPGFQNVGMHNNTNTYMQNVFFGLRASGGKVESFSAIQLPSFPRSRRLFISSQKLPITGDAVTIGVPFINVTPIKQITIGLSMFWRLMGWGVRMRHHNDRIICSFNISVPPLLFTLLAARLVGARIVVYICDVIIPGQTAPGNLLYRIDARLHTWLLRFVEGCMVISDRIAMDLMPGRPYVRVDGGVSRSVIEETGRLLNERRSNEVFTIVATASLLKMNGVHEILAAFSQLKGPQYRLIVTGRGLLEGDVTAAASADSRIEFRGFVEYPELLALQCSADVLVCMRIFRKVNTAYSFPSKMFEYLLSGVPVITTATGHMKAEYGPYCYILDEETPETLAALLRKIECLAPTERARIGASARQFMIEHKTWEVQHKRIADFVSATAISHD